MRCQDSEMTMVSLRCFVHASEKWDAVWARETRGLFARGDIRCQQSEPKTAQNKSFQQKRLLGN
jgi:hypothetical protein